MKERLTNISANLIITAIAVIILLFMINGGNTQNITVKVSLDKKPIIKTYTFTNPTVYKEKIIEYNTYEIMTKEDSDLVVKDYLKERQYFDSIFNDTAKVRYHATVSRNALNDLKIDYSYRPIKITETRIKKGINVGLAPGWMNNKPSLGLMAGFETNKYTYGVIYDAFNKGGYLIINRRLFLKK
jgi:hypothetical protein